MRAQEAKQIAVKYLLDACDSCYTVLAKVQIDDAGTMSEEGYTVEEIDMIKQKLDFLIRKMLR